MLTRYVCSYLNDGVELGSSGPIILAVEAAARLSHQTLNLIRLHQLTLGFLLLFVAGVGFQLEHRTLKSLECILKVLIKAVNQERHLSEENLFQQEILSFCGAILSIL